MVACRGFIDIELADRRATDKRRSMAGGRTRVCGSGSTRALFVPSVANFKTARTLALDHDLAVLAHILVWRTWRPAASVFSAISVARFRQLQALHRDTYRHG